jgi:hypothetical protein
MKNIMKGAIRDEKGYVLITVLILLVVGGLILAPLLGLMSTGLLAGQVYEKKTDELYAADAGVEDAIWRIQTNNLTFDANNCSEPWQITVNDRSVEVVVYREDLDPTPCGENFTYQILSTAATDDGGGTAAIDSSTTIDAHITPTINYYPTIMDQLITIHEDIVDDKQLEDDIWKLNIACPAECEDCELWCKKAYDYYTEYDNIPTGCKGCVAVYNFPTQAWPTASDLSAQYLNDVEDAQTWPSTIIDLETTDVTLPALYIDGTLDIRSSDNKETHNVTLDGTLYVTGDTAIGKSGNGDFILNLNGNTIFAESNSSNTTGSIALAIGGKCTVQGPGILIAVGDVDFSPKSVIGGEQDPVFILSIEGSVTVKPSGDWYGAIASNNNVHLGSGKYPNTMYPPDGFGDLAFPRTVAGWTYNIASWEINPE